MPQKRQHNSRPQGKTEIAQKVKEIKQRQQNWFKQREESAASQRTNDQECTEVDRGGEQGDTGQQKAPGFTAWMKARSKEEKPTLREQRRTPLGASYVISKDASHAGQERLPHSTPSPHFHSPQLSNHTSLPPDDFDQLADQILNRVKKELNGKPYYAKQYEDLNTGVTRDTKTQTVTNSYSSAASGHHSNTPVVQQPSPCPDTETLSTHPDGHLCPQCAHIMTGEHEPMLIIPCGHNICKACSELEDVDLCAVCSCEVGSFTSNIMLKQIIGDYKRDRKRMESSRKLASSRNVQPAEEDEKDYKEEIKTLMIRLDVLETESDHIKETMTSIEREIAMEKKQVSNIERQEDKIKQEIEELSTKLDTLANHKQGYFDRCEALEQKHTRQEEKLQMVKDTIRQLNRDVEKLQLIGGGDR